MSRNHHTRPSRFVGKEKWETEKEKSIQRIRADHIASACRITSAVNSSQRLRINEFNLKINCPFLPLNTHTHTYIHIYTHTHTHIYIYIYIPIYTHTHTHIYIYTHLHTRAHTHTHTHIYPSTHTHTHTYIYIPIYTHAHTHTHTHACMHAETFCLETNKDNAFRSNYY